MKNPNYKERINAYRDSANRGFQNFEGQPQLPMYGMNAEPFNNYGGAVDHLDSSNDTLLFTFTNTSGSNQTVTLFNAEQDYNDTTLPAGVTVSIAGTSHIALKHSLFGNPLHILGMRYIVTTVAQLSNSWTMKRTDRTGALVQGQYHPVAKRSAQNNITTQIDDPLFELEVDGQTAITFTIANAETPTIEFHLVQAVNNKNILSGRPWKAISNRPPATGLPQVDIPVFAKQRGI